MASSVPSPPVIAQEPHPSLYAERMARVDGCPEVCGNYALPRAVREAGDGFQADYVCESCGAAWSTGWRD